MTKSIFLRGCATGAIALGCVVANPAYATGTVAGSTITNSVTVDYKVNNIDQTDATASNDIVVDRKINLSVARVDDTATLGHAERDLPGGLVPGPEPVQRDARFRSGARCRRPPARRRASPAPTAFNVSPTLTYYLDDGDNVFDAGDTAAHTTSTRSPRTRR